jgi:hypothetical protein
MCLLANSIIFSKTICSLKSLISAGYLLNKLVELKCFQDLWVQKWNWIQKSFYWRRRITDSVHSAMDAISELQKLQISWFGVCPKTLMQLSKKWLNTRILLQLENPLNPRSKNKGSWNFIEQEISSTHFLLLWERSRFKRKFYPKILAEDNESWIFEPPLKMSTIWDHLI